MQGEKYFYGGLSTRVRDKKNYAYRVHEDPTKDGIVLDVPIKDLKGLILSAIHRFLTEYLA